MPCRLFKAAVEDQLHRLKAEKDEKEKQKLQLSETAADDVKDSAELTLIRWAKPGGSHDSDHVGEEDHAPVLLGRSLRLSLPP